MSKYYVAKFYGDYADEFDVEGIELYTEGEYNEVQQCVKTYGDHKDFLEEEVTVGFGSNEWLEYTVEELLDSVSFEEITEEEYNVLNKHVSCFGLVTPSQVYENIQDSFEYFKENQNEED